MAVVNANPVVQANKTLGYTPGNSTISLGIPAPTDPNGDALTIRIYEMPSWGTIRKADGTLVTSATSLTPAEVAGLVYTVDPSKSGNAGNFTYGVSDGKGGFSYQVVTLNSAAPVKVPTITPPTTQSIPTSAVVVAPPVNHAPQAQADKTFNAVVGQQASLAISAPTDSDGDSLSIKITTLPSKGVVVLSNGQAFTIGQVITAAQLAGATYKSPSSTLGAMGAFAYQVTDGKGGVAQQSVAINIVQPAAPVTSVVMPPAPSAPVVVAPTTPSVPPAPVNHAPVADTDKSMSLAWGSNQALNIKAPTDSDGDTLTIKVTSVPTGGTLKLADNSLVQSGQTLTAAQLAGLQFTAPATGGTIGSPTSFGNFTYSVNDGHGGTTAQTVSLFGNAVTTANPVSPPASAIIGLAREAYVARPGGLLNLGNMIQVGSGGTLPAKITVVGSDNNHYAGAETYNYGTLTAKSGVTYAGAFTLTFSLVNGQYVTTPAASMTSTEGLTLSDFVFAASSQENRVQTLQVTAFNQAGAALEQRTVSVLTSATFADTTPGIASAAEVAQIAQSFIGQTWDVNGCWNLANAISERAGASLDLDASGGAYQQNVGANGQWTIAYNAASGVNNAWLSTLKAGDMVEWTPKNANFSHIAAVSKVVNGQVYIVDNAGAASTAPGADAADVLVVETILNNQAAYIDSNSVVVMRLGGPLPGVSDLPATVSVDNNRNLQTGQTVAASTLFAASDPDNNAIQSYRIRDNSAGGGSFHLNGAQQADGNWINVAANQLSGLSYKAGSSRSVDTIEVQAFDGTSWSAISSGRAITLGSQTIDDNSATPTALGTLSASKTTVSATDVLSRNDIQDFYSFTLSNAATVNLSLSDLAADCRLDIFGPFGSGYSAASGKGGTQSESITAALAAGTYLVRAAYETGGPQTNQTNYDLSITLVPQNQTNTSGNLVVGG